MNNLITVDTKKDETGYIITVEPSQIVSVLTIDFTM